MSKTIDVMFGLSNMIISFFFVVKLDERTFLKYEERARKITEWARNSFRFWFLPTRIMTLKSSASFNIKERSFERPEWNIEVSASFTRNLENIFENSETKVNQNQFKLGNSI